jgi:hypothetical protein
VRDQEQSEMKLQLKCHAVQTELWYKIFNLKQIFAEKIK